MAFNKGYVKEKMEGFRRFTPLLRELVVRDIKVRYRHSALGLVWTVLNPLLMMVVITIVFSTLFKQNIPNFPIYYLSGSLIFAFNSESTTTALNSIISNASLIKKVYIPKYLFPLSNVLSGLVNLGFSLIAMFIVMLITDAPFHATLLLLPIPIFYTFLFSVGLGILLSAVTVFFRDIAHLQRVHSRVDILHAHLLPCGDPAGRRDEAHADQPDVPSCHLHALHRALRRVPQSEGKSSLPVSGAFDARAGAFRIL